MVISDFGYTVGRGKPGPLDRITDVPGVLVGHATVDEGRNHTGVTLIFPCAGSIAGKRPTAASYVLNGYGKTAGLVQIDELGYLETPIALTNTLNVGKVLDAMVELSVRGAETDGWKLRSINPVVGETNDSMINDICVRAVGLPQVEEAARAAQQDGPAFAQGAVGAGRGTVCFGLKGGIGSASRLIRFAGQTWTIGALVQSNFGSLRNLMICGDPVGERIQERLRSADGEDKGSIMVVIGTDLPLDARQLRRVLKRAAVGLVRTGSFMGHGSGDVFIGFTTGNDLPVQIKDDFLTERCFPEDRLDRVFEPAAEAVEEAVLNSLVNAEPSETLEGKTIHSLREFLDREV